MANLFEFFFNLLLLIWNNIEAIIQPILSFLSSFSEFAIGAITKAFEWLLGALDWIIDLVQKIADFFGLGAPPNFGGGGGHGR